MQHRKLLRLAFIITFIYLAISISLLLLVDFNVTGTSSTCALLQTILILPATMIFIVDSNEGSNLSPIRLLFTVGTIYLFILFILYIIAGLRFLFGKGSFRKTTLPKAPVSRQINSLGLVYLVACWMVLYAILQRTNIEYPLFFSTFIYTSIYLFPQLLLTRESRWGMRHIRVMQYDQAIPHFEKSCRFFQRYSWLDKYRLFLLGNVSSISFHESGLCNIAFCYGQTGKIQESKKMYEEIIRRYPENGIAIASLKLIKSAESSKQA